MPERPPKQPTSVTILLWGVFIGGLVNIWRAWAITEQSALFQTFDFTIPLLTNLMVALLSVLFLFALGVMLKQGRPIVRVLLPAFLTLYAASQFTSKWLWGATIPGWQMWLIFYNAGILFTIWVCWQPKNKDYWKDVG
jgi:hypothetical protein